MVGQHALVLRQLDTAAAAAQGYCHAAASGILRASQDDLMAGCTRVAEDVVRSPALLSRPAALCKRLAICHSNCLVDGTSSSSSNSNVPTSGSAGSKPAPVPAKDAVFMCSPTGLLSGVAKVERAIDPATAKEGSMCLSSADCPSGMDCDTFSAATCWPKCDPATGMDR